MSPFRTFLDSTGTRWDVCEVAPRALHLDVDERRRADRPKLPPARHGATLDFPRRRPGLAGALGGGWLLFRSATERRRLAPVPLDWAVVPEEVLERYCRRAGRDGRDGQHPAPASEAKPTQSTT